jgi:hypothetical protein
LQRAEADAAAGNLKLSAFADRAHPQAQRGAAASNGIDDP